MNMRDRVLKKHLLIRRKKNSKKIHPLSPSFYSPVFLLYEKRFKFMIDIKKIDKIVSLLLAERKRVLTNDERLELDEWLNEKPGNQMLYNSLKKKENIQSKLKTLNKYNQDNAYAKFIRQIKGTGNLKIRQFLRYAALLIPFFLVIHLIYQKTLNVESEIRKKN